MDSVEIKLIRSATVAGQLRDRGWNGKTTSGEATLLVQHGKAVIVPEKTEKPDAARSKTDS